MILESQERRALIKDKATKLVKKLKLELKDDPELLNEVAGLVEWPVTYIGSIDAAFMGLPDEVLSTTMRKHQKYFSCLLYTSPSPRDGLLSRMPSSA